MAHDYRLKVTFLSWGMGILLLNICPNMGANCASLLINTIVHAVLPSLIARTIWLHALWINWWWSSKPIGRQAEVWKWGHPGREVSAVSAHVEKALKIQNFSAFSAHFLHNFSAFSAHFLHKFQHFIQRISYKVSAQIQRIRRKNSALLKKFRSKKISAHFLQSFSANSAHP